jgi:AraC-like DNA-binding protein
MMPSILYSCYYEKSREGEHFVHDHVFSYQISGTLDLNDGDAVYNIKEGDFGFCRRNHLAKFVKYPPEKGVFKSISVFIGQDFLRAFSLEYGMTAGKHVEGPAIMPLPPDPRYHSFMQSLLPYESEDWKGKEKLIELKLKEAVLLLIQTRPEMKDILFDFTEPGKIDLEAFMNKNYHFNVGLKRFAYLTGRSLATFKRDFGEIFHLSPSRWLQQRRLREAHYLIKERGAAPSEVYLDLGFEDLSHFSFAFKKMFGVAPSRIT